VPVNFAAIRPQEQPYACHPGTQPGSLCTFHLEMPTRSRAIPYAFLLTLDTLGEHLITLRYTFAEVAIVLGRDFVGAPGLLEDLSGFRVAHLRESRALRLQIRCDPWEERMERF
jgi:hypothetical protein